MGTLRTRYMYIRICYKLCASTVNDIIIIIPRVLCTITINMEINGHNDMIINYCKTGLTRRETYLISLDKNLLVHFHWAYKSLPLFLHSTTQFLFIHTKHKYTLNVNYYRSI